MSGNTLRFPSLAAVAFIAACEPQAPQPRTDTVPIARPATQTSGEFGDYVVHFNALTTDHLTPQIAREYGFVRSKSRAILTVSILRKQTDGPPTAAYGKVSASAVNLTGQLKNLTMREIDEGTGIYYIGEVAVTNAETLIFSIDVVPADEEDNFSMRYTRQFFVD